MLTFSWQLNGAFTRHGSGGQIAEWSQLLLRSHRATVTQRLEDQVKPGLNTSQVYSLSLHDTTDFTTFATS